MALHDGCDSLCRGRIQLSIAFVFSTGDGDAVLHVDSTEHDGAGHDEQGDGKDSDRESNQTVMTE